MALSISSRPDRFASAYLPVEYKMTSTRMPNSRTGERYTTGSIYGLKTQQTFGATGSDIEVGTNVLVSANLTDSVNQLIVGSYVLLENAGAYSGVHRITEIIGGNGTGGSIWYFKIDAVVQSSTPFEDFTFSAGGEYFLPLVSRQAVTVSKWYNNYSAIADLYISGNFVARFRKKLDINDEFVFDFSTVLQEYLGSDLATLDSTTLYQASADLSKDFHIEYAQEFDVIDANGQGTLTIGSFTSDVSNTKTAVNSVIPYVGMNDFSIFSVNYDLITDYGKDDTLESQKFLTNQPSTIRIGSSDHYALSYINNLDKSATVSINPAGSYNTDLAIKTYDSSGSLIALNTTTIKTDLGSDIKKTQSVLVGTSNLSAYITSETVKYEVYVRFDSNNMTEVKTFEIDSTCYKNEFRFEWLNKLGGVDAFTFHGKYYKTTDIKKEVFKRSLNASRTIPERQTTTLNVISEDIHKVNSGIVSKAERDWLEELLESPEVYIIVDGYRLPVQVSSKFDFEKLAEDSYNVGFEFSLAYDKITQRN